MASHLAPLPLSSTAVANVKTNGSIKSDGSAHLSGSDHWLRYAQLRGVEDTKNNFIQDILTRYDSVLRQCQDLINQQDARRDSISDLPARELLVCQQNVAHMQRLLDREPFVTVLIDGNSLIFKDAFLRDGEKGGRQAAVKLKNAIAQWVPDSIISPPAEFRMNIKVYADFRALAGILLRNGSIENLMTLGDFARGFNSLYDFIDIGGGDVNNKLVGTYSVTDSQWCLLRIKLLTACREPQIVSLRLSLSSSTFWRTSRIVGVILRRRRSQEPRLTGAEHEIRYPA
jgi:hypothetical protein